ncbi:unnamed protein product [Symbiodinium sp. CCMP2592]|nr:unnamed protein product [Symbiodinium sp. CCMP2592]
MAYVVSSMPQQPVVSEQRPQGHRNGVARPVLEIERLGRNDEEGSFTQFGRALGPSAQSHPAWG